MGQPSGCNDPLSRKGRQVAELKHLSRPRKRDNSPSSGERTGRSPNQQFTAGVVGPPIIPQKWLDEWPWEGQPETVIAR